MKEVAHGRGSLRYIQVNIHHTYLHVTLSLLFSRARIKREEEEGRKSKEGL